MGRIIPEHSVPSASDFGHAYVHTCAPDLELRRRAWPDHPAACGGQPVLKLEHVWYQESSKQWQST